MYLIVGLGNPGKEHESTRHNVGFKVIDRLSKDLNITVRKDKCQALIGQGDIDDERIMLVKPQTFMNLSGTAVSSLLKWFKFSPEKVIIIYDDLDLDIGTLRIRPKGNAGGHKGVASIISALKTTEFPRVRIGIGRASINGDSTEYVLSKIPPTEQESIDFAVVEAADAVQIIVKDGIEEAMNRHNSSSK